MRTGICVICGKSFQYQKGKKVTCSIDCKIERNRQYASKRNEELKSTNKQKAPAKKKNNLCKDAKAARKLGISYGQYMARKEGQAMSHE